MHRQAWILSLQSAIQKMTNNGALDLVSDVCMRTATALNTIIDLCMEKKINVIITQEVLGFWANFTLQTEKYHVRRE